MNKRLKLLFCYFCVILFLSSSLSAQVVINEFMASNSSVIVDEDDEYVDWIELYNSGDSTVQMQGYGLSDDPAEPFKWILPEMRIKPQQHSLFFASDKDRNIYIEHWQTVIDWGDIWKYRPGIDEPLENWNSLDFDDTQWREGATSIGYGDEDDATEIEPIRALYIRKTFLVDDIDAVVTAQLNVDYDDAFVAYLNGTEFARSNIGTPGIRPSYDQKADNSKEARIYKGNLPESFEVENIRTLLQNGENVLAIQVHGRETSARDMTIIPFLTFGMNKTPENPRGVSDLIQTPGFFLHTNFKLNADGEKLLLTAPNQQIADSITFVEMPRDISFGRQPDGGNDWFFFSNPTPRTANDTTSAGLISTDVPIFSHSGRIYQKNINLELSAPSTNSTIRYTLDGTEPSDTSTIYSESLLINVDQTTVVRARIFTPGFLPGEIITNSYIKNRLYEHPVISISIHPPNLWDYENGIYVMGPNALPQNPHFNANFWQEWEKPIHIEFFETDGSPGFSLDAGMRIYGGWTRAFEQKSVAIFARSRYGPSSIDYKIFPDEPIDSFKTFVLRNSGNDWLNTHFRDALMQRLVKDLELDGQAYRPAIVYLNGVYWGIYNIREKINEHYLTAHYGIAPSDVDLLESSVETQDGAVLEGDNIHYRNMIDYINTHDLSDNAHYNYITTQMDVNNFMDYQIAQIYFDNKDWPHNNIKYWREKTDGSKWRWFLYDTDFGFGLYENPPYNDNTLAWATGSQAPWSTFLLNNLLKNQRFRNAFIHRFTDHLNTIFHPDRIIQIINEMEAFIELEIENHINRWERMTLTSWRNEVERLRDFATQRSGYVRQYIQNKFALSGSSELTVNLSQPEGGKIEVNKQYVRQFPWNGVYFNDIPIRITALPNPGYRFSHWSGDETSEEATIWVQFEKDFSLTAVIEPSNHSAGTVVFNEVNHNSADNFDTKDWIELYNDSQNSVDLSNWWFQDSNDKNIFIFPTGTILDSGNYLVVARDTTSLKKFFPNLKSYIGEFNFGLNSDKETLNLIDNGGNIIDSLTYINEIPWPEIPNEGGTTLALKDPSLDNAVPGNWSKSVGHGSPGAINDITTSIKLKQESSKVPNIFVLEQNYPNPFNASTIITFALPKSSEIELAVFDVLGRRVRMLAQETHGAGTYSVLWAGEDDMGNPVSSGVYFLRLQAGRQVVTLKALLLK